MKMSTKILIVDDELPVRESLKAILGKDYELLIASSGEEALHLMREEPAIVLLDILMPDMDGFEVLGRIKRHSPDTVIIMITAVNVVKSAVKAMKLGVYNYITKPFEIEEIRSIVRKVLSKRAREEAPAKAIGETHKLREIFELIKKVSQSDAPALIIGESGVGKELAAQAIHLNGPRRDKPFVTINCAAIPETLIESELFGYEKGAFTDAQSRKLGRLEMANGGTLFLDEIADLSLHNQAKMLRFLQYHELTRIGGTQTIRVDARLIAATNKDLTKLVKEERFREDLCYRIKVIPIYLPPLRERKEDIPLLVDHFIKEFSQKGKKEVEGISEEAMELLYSYMWPGNVRELENVINQAVALSTNHLISVRDLPEEIKGSARERERKVGLPQIEKELERGLILNALKKANFVQTKAAEILGISRRILKYKMDKLEIKVER